MKFYIRSIIFVLIGTIALLIMNGIYTGTQTYKDLNGTEKFGRVPQGIEICNLGSSHGTSSFIYAELPQTSFNFAMGAQKFCYDKRILKQYIDNIEASAIVFIPISYFSLYAGQHSESFERSNPRYYAFLDNENIIDYKVKDYIKYDLLPILSADNSIIALFNGKKANPASKWVVQDKSTRPIAINRYTDEQLIPLSKVRAQSVYDIIEQGRPYTNDVEQDLADIIEICKSNGFKPVLITSPLTKYYNDNFSDDFYAEFLDRVNGFANKHNVIYLDYSHDERFEENTYLFGDADHLNYTGGIIFTERLLTDLNKIEQ